MGSFRQILPKNIVDTLSFCYAMSLIHSVVILGDFFVAPWMKENYGTTNAQILWYNVYGGFIYFNVIGNMWKIMSTNTSTIGIILPTLLKPGWQYCAVCEANAPPRSFHCQTCNRCILKRDHHCMFTGKCIGYFNHRYYICLICYTWLGAMFASTYCMGFAWTILGEFSFYNLMCFCFPLILLLFGMLDFYTAIVCLLTLVSTLFWLIITFLLSWHSKHIIYNLTTHERRHNIYTYNLGLRENIRHIFGSKWYICWLFPWISSPLPGDGMSFPTSANFENPKDQ